MINRFGLALLAPLVALATPAAAEVRLIPKGAPPADAAPPEPTYADTADLADSARFVLRAQVRKVLPVQPERAPGVRAGWGRFYIEARTRALVSGPGVVGEILRYLADMPLDLRGRPPGMAKREVLLFARSATPSAKGKGTDLALVAPDAHMIWSEPREALARRVISDLQQDDAPAGVRGLREAIHVPGTLAGEGETQLFLAMADDSAASISVVHRPGAPVAWGVSFSEVVAGATGAPPRETLAWYRLACFLPAELPRQANLSATPADAAQAVADYRLVRRELGECPRTRR